MTPDEAVRQLEDELRREPRNVGIRLRLAAALREAGRDADAVSHYHALARAYRSAGELRQAMAACHSALAIEPGHSEMRILLAQLQAEDARDSAPAQARPPGVPSQRRDSEPRFSPDDMMRTLPGAVPIMEVARMSSRRTLPREVERVADAEDEMTGSARRSPLPDFEQFLSADDAAVVVAPAAFDPSDPELARATDEVRVPPSLRRAGAFDDSDPAGPSLVLDGAGAEEADESEEEIDFTQPSSEIPDRAPERADAGTVPSPVTKVRGSPTPSRESAAVEDVGLEIARAFDRSFSEALLQRGGPSGLRAPFPGLSDRALTELSRGIERREVARGEIILREGEPGDACFVIVRGEVRILKRDPVNPRGDLIEVARLQDGDLFGEFALLADRRRHATVQAVQACELYVISRRLLRRLSEGYPEVVPAEMLGLKQLEIP